MNGKMNTQEQLSRMKSLMNYGLKTENKQSYSTVEYQKVGADGNVYGIVREGTKYYIKSAPNKPTLVKEDFKYIGGFRNRKDNEYNGFALAQKQFDLKMKSLKEATNKTDFNINSWDLDKKENVVVEASDKMRNEILRERQIMRNAMAIHEKKAVCCDTPSCPKDNIEKGEKPTNGKAENAVEHEKAELPKEMTESAVNEEEVLGWNDNKDYMDKSHGTEIGDTAPFNDAAARDIDDGEKKVSKTGEMKNGVVENHGTSMHDAESQDTPSVGVGEGPSDDNNKPFDDEKGKQIDEAIDDFGAENDELGDEGDIEDDEFGAEGDGQVDDELTGDKTSDLDMDDELEDDEAEDEVYESDLEDRMSAMEELLGQIAAKLGVEEAPVDDAEYEDDDLFGDENSDDFEIEDDEDDMPMENHKRKGVQIFETKAFKQAMKRQRMNEDDMKPFKDRGRVPQGNMNKLNDFGKHPAYQKKVMELPPKDLQEFPGYYDMNDESAYNDSPYGEKIGSSAPFEIDPKAIDNAIAEAFKRLKKKSK